MTSRVRTRFAPSPTGELHLGNVRTAILNWLFARRHDGAFVLRLEDTDVERNVPGSEAAILEALDWLGLDRDEGPGVGGPFGPYRQSERRTRHRERALALLESGAAFRCYCTPEELEAHREAAIRAGRPPGQDPRCRELGSEERRRLEAEGRPWAIRLRVEVGPVSFEDRLKGTLTIDGADLGDMTLLRADGSPTYNFAVSVDDLDMEISHVIRGVGHLSNTPKQVLLYRTLGVEPPEFVHVPSVLARGGGKLSKRAGAPGALDYRERGFHPDAVLNYLSLLSWSAESGEEFLSRDALIRATDLDRIGATDAEIDEEKMTWLSGRHIRAEAPARLGGRWRERCGFEKLDLDDHDLERAAEMLAERTQLLDEGCAEVRSLFEEPDPGEGEPRGILEAPGAGAALEATRAAWAGCAWRPDELTSALGEARQEAGLSGKVFFQPVRAALHGAIHGPDLARVAYAIGPRRTLDRLERAIRWIRREGEDA